jgi:hypothetical protein
MGLVLSSQVYGPGYLNWEPDTALAAQSHVFHVDKPHGPRVVLVVIADEPITVAHVRLGVLEVSVPHDAPQSGEDLFSIEYGEALNNSGYMEKVGQRPGSAVRTYARPTFIENYPNPFNPMTIFRYSVPQRTPVELSVYSVDGRLVRSLVSEKQSVGQYAVEWDGTDLSGHRLPSGIYVYSFVTDAYRTRKKLVIVR